MGTLDLPTAAAVAGAAVESHVLRELRERGFTGLRPRHGYVLQRLLAGPGTASSMARDLGASQHVVATIVRELVALGYAERVAPQTDRRGRPVALTSRGRQAVDAATAASKRLDARLRDAVGGPRADDAVVGVRTLLRLLETDDAVDERRVKLPDARS